MYYCTIQSSRLTGVVIRTTFLSTSQIRCWRAEGIAKKKTKAAYPSCAATSADAATTAPSMFSDISIRHWSVCANLSSSSCEHVALGSGRAFRNGG